MEITNCKSFLPRLKDYSKPIQSANSVVFLPGLRDFFIPTQLALIVYTWNNDFLLKFFLQ